MIISINQRKCRLPKKTIIKQAKSIRPVSCQATEACTADLWHIPVILLSQVQWVPEHCGMQGQLVQTRPYLLVSLVIKEPICFFFSSNFVETTGCMKWVFQDEANWLLMKFVLKGISPPPSVQFQNADYPFDLLHINYQCDIWPLWARSGILQNVKPVDRSVDFSILFQSNNHLVEYLFLYVKISWLVCKFLVLPPITS